MIALYFLYYNFGRVHQTLRVTPAMEAGISDHIWSIEEICALLPVKTVFTAKKENALVLKALGQHPTGQPV